MKILFLLSLTLTLLQTCTDEKVRTSPDLPQPYFIALIVKDIKKSEEWYTQVFEMEALSRYGSEEQGFRQINLSNKYFLLELIELQNAVDPKTISVESDEKTRFVGIFKYGFKVMDFDAWLAHLESHNVVFNGSVVTDVISGNRTIIVLDPDENRIQIFEK